MIYGSAILLNNDPSFITIMIDERTQVSTPGCYSRIRMLLVRILKINLLMDALLSRFRPRRVISSFLRHECKQLMRQKRLDNQRKKKRKKKHWVGSVGIATVLIRLLFFGAREYPLG
jgi:hypothetical protein